ncbi:YccF domain-containing protein [Corynebacterium aquatimens]|uniref:Uncharacterized membrane protein YccF (DUF307 family) n=1 Tax=Corynebacterium aquatimens TaxID=1190508 RepID=A0A931DXR9_9CORY|nr:YccF domain-containing protein [Corynebacterium aquatimens]MBG6122267.1 uncharacterized membrane protein YccF (DUF307 family) [Corynebacterium aquatimens]WJY65192.1 Inner membrane protein YccF [Corynebacterium aquatimens]
MGLLRFVLNVIWLVTAGIWLFLSYVLAGIVACLLVVTIPFGLASFRIAGYVLWPFGREVVEVRRGGVMGGVMSGVGNVVWFLIAGLWLAIGHIITAFAQAVTIIGLPMAWANLKLIPVTCFPFGKEIVDSSDDRSRFVPVTR